MPGFLTAALRSLRGGRAVALVLLIPLLGLQGLAERDDLNPLRPLAFDLYQSLKPRAAPALPVAIIAIDEASLKAHGQWPWPRGLLARLVARTAELKPRAIGLDMVMPEPDRLTPANLLAYYPMPDAELRRQLAALRAPDELFAEAIAGLPVVVGRAGVAGATLNSVGDPPAQTPVLVKGADPEPWLIHFPAQLASLPVIDRAARGHGLLNVSLDGDGVARRVPLVAMLDEVVAPALALELLRVAWDADWFTVHSAREGVRGVRLKTWFIPTDPDGTVSLYFATEAAGRRYSAAEVLAGRYPAGALAGRLALIGVTALGIGDAQPTPVAARMDGVEIQAQVIETLLSGARLIRPPWAPALEAALSVLACLVLMLTIPRLPPLSGLLVPGVLALVYMATGFAAFAQDRLLLDPTVPVIGAGLMFLGMTVSALAVAEGQRRRLNAALIQRRLENARLAGELDAAGRMQKDLLPDVTAIEGLPELVTLAAVLEPARQVGGDLFDAFMLDRHRLCFLVGDVSDKGVRAALFMALSKGVFRNMARRGGGSVGDLVTAVNGEIARDNPAQLFITALVGVMDTRSGALEFCSAGHPDPLLLRPGQPPCRLAGSGGPPLGILEGFAYAAEQTRLEAGDKLVLMTDGITEAHGEDGRMYGYARVVAWLETLPAKATPRHIVQGLSSAVEAFMGNTEPADDRAILAIQWSGSPRPA